MAATYIPSSPTQSICLSSDSEDECPQREYKNQNNHRKSVQFSSHLVVVHETWCNDEYDRTSTEPARLSYQEYSDLLQLRCDLQRETDKMMKAAAALQNANDQDNHAM
ncbi:6605_t:CDS:1 [Acaulospora morrowiae]|uniref:6605_t:CDS:1 n=1 Tax=Acaulospora morrowiae TaxID=94023 RepID=A0A9N8WGE3_9GLOM|nr:6605_t:CDS:1 [Acaulospora morrowiae]